MSTEPMEHADDHRHRDGEVAARVRRNPAPYILVVVVAILAAYYVVLWITGALRTSIDVPVDGADPAQGSRSYVSLQLRVQEVDVTSRVIYADVLPVPHGSFVGQKAGEMTRSLRIQIASGGDTTSVVTFPRQAVVDPTALSFALDRGDAAYPFDRPFADFAISVEDDKTGASIPFEVEMSNSARPWALSATIADPSFGEEVATYAVTLDGHRDPLNVTLVGFYVLAILLTTVIAVVTIGSAILRRKLEFSNIIWLSATMVSFPALRAAMPGAPPIGTALDFVVFFPCMCLIAAMLLWTGAHLVGRESGLLRLRVPHREEMDDSRVTAGPTAPAGRPG